MQKVGLKNAKKFKEENDNNNKYERIRKFYEIRKDIQNQLGGPVNTDAVLVSLCNINPSFK